MIATELERATRAYLIAVTGTLVTGDGDSLGFEAMPQGLPQDESAGGLSIQTEGQADPVIATALGFHFYTGENNTDINLPCVIIAATSGDEDFDTGNESVELTVAVHVPALPYGTVTDPRTSLLEISEAFINALRRDDLAAYLNTYRPDPERFSAIGVSARTTAKNVDGTKHIHQISLTLYCAACDLESGVVLAGFSPTTVTEAERDTIPGTTQLVIFNTDTQTYQGRLPDGTWTDLHT